MQYEVDASEFIPGPFASVRLTSVNSYNLAPEKGEAC